MEYDLIVIGGGINGCGIARDAAMRGLKVILIEKNDFASGTTGASSQMIHGGARYLLHNWHTTKLSSLDSGYIQKIVPHLLFRIPFLVPVVKNPHTSQTSKKLYLESVETFFEAYDKFSALKNGKVHTRLSRDEVLSIEPDLTEDVLGAVSFDEWGVDVFRLCIGNVLSARRYGCEICNHTEITQVIKEAGRVVGVKVKDLISGDKKEIRGKIIFNATGPWSPRLAKLAGASIKLRPSKGVHITFDRRLTNYAITTSAIDGRSIFLMPYQNTSILGTTDDDYFGDPDDISISEDDVEYLLEGIERVFPRIRQARMIRAWAGVRPTLYKRGVNEDVLSRDHALIDHEEQDRLPGFLSMVGGKLASYRLMSEEAVDLVCKKLGKMIPCRSHLEVLPGAEQVLDPEDLSIEFQISHEVAKRLVYRYGTKARDVLGLSKDKIALRSVVCGCEAVLEAEMRYAVRHEWARSLDDLMRRTRFAKGPCQGSRCTMMGARILGEELDLDTEKILRATSKFMKARYLERLPILKGVSLQQEEMHAYTHYHVGNLK